MLMVTCKHGEAGSCFLCDEEDREHDAAMDASFSASEKRDALAARLAEKDETIDRMQGLLETCDASMESLRARLAEAEASNERLGAIIDADIWYERARKAEARLAEAEALLRVAACPNKCDDGAITMNCGGNEWEQEPCQFCYEREAFLRPADSATGQESADE